MKQCIKCKNLYELENFPKDISRKDGHRSYCFQCNRLIINESTLKRKHKRHQENIINRELISEYNKKYYDKNKQQYQKYFKNKMKTDINFRLSVNFRSRINSALKKGCKKTSSFDLLGCSIEEYKLYLEKQFDENMNWENYGKYWDIDHIKPCTMFNLTCLEEQKQCFHYSNTQPLSKKENQIKNRFYKI
jgi:uncharacterized membrane protein YheB (UPF0754 family)